MENLAAKKMQQLIDDAVVNSLFEYDENLIDGATYSIRVAIPEEQKKDVEKLHGIDLSAMMFNVLANEGFHNLAKILMKNISDAEETSSLDHKFIVTSGRVASCLQKDVNFNPISGKEKTLQLSGGLYCAGTIGDSMIIVDPHISWSQTHALVFDKEHPITFRVEEQKTDEHLGLIFNVKVSDDLKCFVWNCPQEILDKL